MEGLRLNLRIHHSQMTIVAQVHLNDSMKHDYASVFDRVEKLIPELTIRLPGAPSSSSFPLLALHVGSADVSACAFSYADAARSPHWHRCCRSGGSPRRSSMMAVSSTTLRAPCDSGRVYERCTRNA